MNIQKAHWQNSEHSMQLSFPIAKVNKEKRTVSGFASLDNIDRHGDIVTSDASKKAFERFRGNIREMHQPVAVGKMLSFNYDSFLDKESNKTYNGVYVTAYVSKGAQDTWEKVLDGTLTGFSIGGNIVDSKMEKANDGSGEDRRVIHDYDLHELSLVDSPANPLANIFSIQKTDGGSIFKGMIADIVTENVFWCKNDQIASSSIDAAKDCIVCGDTMSSIGWIEQTDTNKFDSINKVVDAYLQKDDAPGPTHEATTHEGDTGVIDSKDTINLYPDQVGKKKITKGGNTMAEETSHEVVEATQADEVTPQEVDETVTEDETVEKAITVSEVETDDLDFTKMVNDLKNFFGETIEKNYATQAATVQDVYRMVEETRAEMKKSIDEIVEKHAEFNKTITEMYGQISYLDNRIGNYESATAVKKSGDLSGSTEETKIQKSIWQGHFLGVRDL
jgi:acyl carrier protein